MNPQLFIGQSDSTIPGVVLFWLVFYVWVGSEMFLGWKLRPAAGSVATDAGSRWLLISSIWLGIAIGFALAFAAEHSSDASVLATVAAFALLSLLALLAIRRPADKPTVN